MLIQKPIDSNDIVTIKLSTGEELIARLNTQSNGKITISKPMIVSLAQDRAGNVGIQMLPYFLLTAMPDTKLTIDEQKIIVITLANDQAKNSYIQQTSSLAMPSGLNL